MAGMAGEKDEFHKIQGESQGKSERTLLIQLIQASTAIKAVESEEERHF
jgi:hypothetical protein